jgi:hypothetical protein
VQSRVSDEGTFEATVEGVYVPPPRTAADPSGGAAQ